MKRMLVSLAVAGGLLGLPEQAFAEDARAKIMARPAIPTQCDQSAQQAYFGAVGIGTVVQLGMHTPWRGDANWSPDMSGFIGMQATVTSLEGVDAVGCPVVRVNVDNGRSFWRIRDMRLVTQAPPPRPVAPPPPSDPIPRYCGMPAGRATFGTITPGTSVVLNMHGFAGPGDDRNWNDGMQRYVGTSALVTSLNDVDEYGCPVVRVNVDGGQYFWRIRDMQLVGYAAPPTYQPPPPPPQAPTIPLFCGMASGTEQYGPLRPGSTVVLGAHTGDVGDANWSPEMNRWVGMQTTITSLGGIDGQGCPTVRVAADGGRFAWRIRHMSFAQ